MNRFLTFSIIVVATLFFAPLINAARIHKEAKKGHLPGVEFELLENSAHVNEVDHMGRTPLHWAAMGGHLHVVQNLMEQGANPDIIDGLGNTPEDLAFRYRHMEVVRELDPNLVQTLIYPALPDEEQDRGINGLLTPEQLKGLTLAGITPKSFE